jgi:TetR/AcrR family transcriptional regulator, transcriptional repressor for nem operon
MARSKKFDPQQALATAMDVFWRLGYANASLVLSANLERASGDAVIADFLRRNQAGVESIFAQALQRAQAKGELSRKQDPEALARFFVVTIQGMRALTRLKSDRRAREVATVALALLEQS